MKRLEWHARRFMKKYSERVKFWAGVCPEKKYRKGE